MNQNCSFFRLIMNGLKCFTFWLQSPFVAVCVSPSSALVKHNLSKMMAVTITPALTERLKKVKKRITCHQQRKNLMKVMVEDLSRICYGFCDWQNKLKGLFHHWSNKVFLKNQKDKSPDKYCILVLKILMQFIFIIVKSLLKYIVFLFLTDDTTL